MSKDALVILLFIAFVFSGCKKDLANQALNQLDVCIENKDSYEATKVQRIQDLESKLSGKDLSNFDQYDLYTDLYNEYKSYKYDSAYSYAGRMYKLAEESDDKNLIAKSRLALAFSCMSAGLYKEASEISSTIDTTGLKHDIQVDYFSFLSTLNMDMANFSAAEPYYTLYRKKSAEYCSVCIGLTLKEKSSDVTMVKIRECQLLNDYPKAIKIAEKSLLDKNLGLHDYAIISSTLGFFYQIQRDTTRAIVCFANAAVADIKAGTKETAAIRQLAELLYLQGDVQRAFSYATLALDEANYYNARQRKIEIGRVLPNIEAAQFKTIKDQKDKLMIYAGLISVLFILFMVATIIILRQKKHLNKARLVILQQNTELLNSNEMLTDSQKKISKQNLDLIRINEKLKEADRIKDEYIGYFFSVNSAYIEKIENYRKSVARKIKSQQFDDLLHFSNESDMRKEREEMFILFDRIFMKLFPDFVNRYNQLFVEEDRVTIKADGMLTPEIRIFALIRLGVTESERIAKFLDFSLSTVKNYKTKVKNRSIVSNEFFEQKIMEIESIKTDNEDKIS